MGRVFRKRKVVGGIALYYLLAFGLTFLASRLPRLEVGAIDVRLVLCGFGPLLSALICYRVVKTGNACRISLLGQAPKVALALTVVALAVPVFAAGKARGAIVAAVAMQFVYSFGEEYGWRHYLQNATSELNQWTQALTIGTLWFFWHYSFLANPVHDIFGGHLSSFVGIPLAILMLSVLALLFGKLVTTSGSILFPTVAHFITKAGSGIAIVIVLLALVGSMVFWKRLTKESNRTVPEGAGNRTERE